MVIPKTLPKKKGKIKEKGLLREREVPVDYYHVYHDTRGIFPAIIGGEHPPTNTHPYSTTKNSPSYQSTMQTVQHMKHSSEHYTRYSRHIRRKPIQMIRQKILEYVVDTFGKRNGEEFVYLSDSVPKRLEQYDKRPVIILQPFDSAVDTLEKELAQKMIDEIEFQERVLTKKEREKIQKAAKLIIRAVKKMKKLLENRPVWDYKALADAQARLNKQPHLLAREAAEILGIDPLEHFQEEIIELARLFPKVIRPEKAYGDRWYEFLKKKGIDPSELNPGKKKKVEVQKSRGSLSAEAQKLLGILNGLKYAGYSKEAVQSAVDDMVKRAEELAGKGELEALGLYLWTARLLREGRFDDAEKFLRKES